MSTDLHSGLVWQVKDEQHFREVLQKSGLQCVGTQLNDVLGFVTKPEHLTRQRHVRTRVQSWRANAQEGQFLSWAPENHRIGRVGRQEAMGASLRAKRKAGRGHEKGDLGRDGKGGRQRATEEQIGGQGRAGVMQRAPISSWKGKEGGKRDGIAPGNRPSSSNRSLSRSACYLLLG